MTEPSNSQRVEIRKQCVTRARTAFSSKISGFHALPWMPGANANQLFIADGGQGKANYDDDEETKSLALDLEFTLSLTRQWEREAVYNDVCDLVVEIISKFYNWLPSGVGALRMEYNDDSPMDVIMQSGATEAIWVIHFTCTYMFGVGIIGKE